MTTDQGGGVIRGDSWKRRGTKRRKKKQKGNFPIPVKEVKGTGSKINKPF